MWKWVKKLTLGAALWYGLGVLLLAVLWDSGALARVWTLGRLSTALGLLLLGGAFVKAHRWAAGLASGDAQKGESFPTPATVGTGVWLLLSTVASLLAFFWVFRPPDWLTQQLAPFSAGAKAALVTMAAATVGSLITTILGYLDHVAYKGDFRRAFVPWYVARPVMGLLLGLIFYFVLQAGLWAVAGQSPGSLSLYGLAAVGSLVGLFSKNAIEKLRELFQGLFHTEDDAVDALVSRLPDPPRGAVEALLKVKKAPGP